MTKTNRIALRREDWRSISRASSISNPESWRAAIDAIVKARMAKAWAQGYNRGWEDGVADANDYARALTSRRPNPYGEVS